MRGVGSWSVVYTRAAWWPSSICFRRLASEALYKVREAVVPPGTVVSMFRLGGGLLATVGNVGEVVEEGGVEVFGSLESQLLCALMFILVRALAWGAVVSRMSIALNVEMLTAWKF